MKKADLIKGIAQKAGITNEQAQNALEATLDLIKQSVVEQESHCMDSEHSLRACVKPVQVLILQQKKRLKSRNAKLLSSKQAKTLGSKNWLRLFPEG